MAAQDKVTLGFYAAEAEAYTTRGQQAAFKHLDGFMTALPPGGKVLELGCGAGQDSAAMQAAGFDVTPTDGTPEMAAAATKLLGREVAVLLFEDIRAEAVYDGIWANACLLHIPRAELPGILARIQAALKPGGVFYASFKAGTAEGRDKFDRYYNYPSPDWLRGAYGVGWADIDILETGGSGYDKLPTDWLHVTAQKG